MYLFKHLLGFVSVRLTFSFPFGNVAHRASCQPWLTTFASDFKLVANVIGDNSANAHLSISASTGNEGIGSAWIIDQTNNIRFTLVNGALNGTIVNPNEFDDEVGGVSGLSQNDPTIPNFIPSSGLSTEDEISGLIWLAVSDSNCNWTLLPVVNEAIVGLCIISAHIIRRWDC
jgi:hypothetical protein